MIKKCTVKAPQISKEDIAVEIGTTVAELLKTLETESQKYIGVKVNNTYRNFEYVIHRDTTLEFFDIFDFEGERIYCRTITMILDMAVKIILPDAELIVNYSIPRGFNFGLNKCDEMIDYSDDITKKMKYIITQDLLINNLYYHNSKMTNLLINHKQADKINLLKQRSNLYYDIATCGDYLGYYYGVLAHKTGYTKQFEIAKFRNSYIVYHPHTNIEQDKEDFNQNIRLYDTIYYYKRHLQQLNVSNVTSINNFIINNKGRDMIKIAEAQQSKQFVEIATRFHELYSSGSKIILVSGPSSSGKTTFSYKLSIMLKTYGINAHILSMDNYFINRDQIPDDENGEKDFEGFENIDLQLFNIHLKDLMEGKKIEIPKYDFENGVRVKGESLSLEDHGVVLIEGIHALNPRLITEINPKSIFKVFLSPLAAVSMDNTTYFSIDDNRLIRRIIRDAKFRAYSATNTLKRWGSVRRGERKNIFPYQEQADYYFNTSIFYELNVLKPYILRVLMEVPSSESVFAEAQRLINMIEYFVPLDANEVPSDSLIREFIGGSSFDY